MAGVKIEMSTNSSTDWSNFVSIVQHSYRHYQFISLTNTTSTGAPAIEAGSYAIVNGTMYQLTPSTGGNETISTTGLSTGFTDGELWIKCVPSTGTSITAEYTTTAPTWSASKGGYYSTGNDKYIGGVYKSTSRYYEKWLYEEGKRFFGGETRPKLTIEYSMGSWDMDATAAIIIAKGDDFPMDRIYGIRGSFVSNDSTKTYCFGQDGLALNDIFGLHITTTGINVARGGGGNTTDFDDTTMDRGQVEIIYKG